MRCRKYSLGFFLLIFGLFTLGNPSGQVNAAASFSRSPDLLVFSKVKNTGTTSARNVTVTNTSGSAISASMTLTGADAGQFAITSGGGSVSIGADSSHTVGIGFKPTSAGIKIALLQITVGSETETVELRGLGTDGEGGVNEPSLKRILDTLKISVNVGDDDPATVTIHSTLGGTSGMLGAEVPLQRLQKAGSGNVTIEVLAAYANNATPVARVGWYPIGRPGSRTQLFTVNNGSHQTLLPAISGSTSFDPGANAFGLYSIWTSFNNREVYSEDALNIWDTAHPHKMRFYPLGNNAYIAASDEFFCCQPFSFDYNDVVYIIRNVKPFTPTGSPQIRFENLDWVGLMGQGIPNTGWMNTWLTMSRIKTGITKHKFHDIATLRIHNDGGGTLTVSSLTISNTAWFRLVNNETSLSIPAGAFHDLKVQFIANSGAKGARTATLTLNTNNGNHTISLGGGYQEEPEDRFEYFMPDIIAAFGFKSVIGNIPGGQWLPAGEEVMSRRWRVVDASKGVYVRQLAAFHGCCASYHRAPFVMIFEGGGSAQFVHAEDYSQSLLPHNANSPSAGGAEMFVNRGGNFSLRIDGKTACDKPCENNHGIRYWPARDRNGALIPNTYIVAQDYVGVVGVTNYDYNDNVYLVTNIAPLDPIPVDLQVTGSTAPKIKVNSTLRYNFYVKNNSPFPAEQVKLAVTLPTGTTFMAAAAGCTPTTTSPVIVNCDLDTVAGGENRTITVDVRPTVVSTIVASATVSGKAQDFRPANNTTTLSVIVQEQVKPVAFNDEYQVERDTVLNTKIVNGVLANDVDDNYDALTAVKVSDPANGTLTLNTNGSFTYTPRPGYLGNDSFTYRARDGIDLSDNIATVTIRVVAPAPRAVNDPYTTPEDVPLNVNAAGGVLSNDTGGATTLTALLARAPSSASSFTLRPNGSFTYTPATDFFGTDTFVYVATDGVRNSLPATVTITVTSVSDAPVASADAYDVEEDDVLVVGAAHGVLANDYDGDGDPLMATLLANVQHGTLALAADGGFTYTPVAGYRGADGFTYTLSDGTGLTAVGSVTLAVAPTNRAPVLAADHFRAYRDMPLTLSASDGLGANDMHPDGAALSFELMANPSGLNLTISPNGGFTYTPAPGFVGLVRFAYRAWDAQGGSAVALATITVLDEDPPIQLIENGGFENNAARWTANTPGNNRVRCNTARRLFASEGNCAYQFMPSAVGSSLVQRPDAANLGAGARLTFSASVEGKNVVRNAAQMVLTVTYRNGQAPDRLRIRLPEGTYSYVTIAGSLDVRADVAGITVNITHTQRGTKGNFLIDDVRLVVDAITDTLPLTDALAEPSGLLPLPAAPDLRGAN